MQTVKLYNTGHTQKHILLATLYFLLSTIITGWFIATKFWLYADVKAMILSGAIAGAKWLIQLAAAYYYLNQKRWEFIYRIAFVCFTGSCLLLTYNLMYFLPLPLSSVNEFILSLVIAVFVMIVMYYRAVKKAGVSIKWFLGWLACLAIAITLQLTIVRFAV